MIEGVRFMGTTLWTDFEALARGKSTMTQQMQGLEKAYRAANFYLRRFTATRDGVPMLAEQWREVALECQRWLRAAVAEPFAGTTVVVTHHAPSLRSADPRYGLTPGTAGFCNALDELLDHADLWLHGHLHCASDYRSGHGERCRGFPPVPRHRPPRQRLTRGNAAWSCHATLKSRHPDETTRGEAR